MTQGKNIRLLAVDMDGTCLNSRSQMTAETIRALEAAAKAGIIVVPTTGRSLSCLPHRLVGRQNIYRYVISSNGASVADCREKKEWMQTLIPKEQALRLVRACSGKYDKKKIGSTAHIRHEYYVEGRLLSFFGRLVFGKDATKLRTVRSMEDILEKSPYDVEEVQFYFLSAGGKRRTREILQGFPELSCAYTPIYVEIFAKEASKGKALAFLSERLGIAKEEVACIGDGENDSTMFEAAGLRFAMGNAVPELKEKADFILPGNDRDGAAEGIWRILGEKCIRLQ